MTPRPRKRPAEDAMAPTSYRSLELIETLPIIRWNLCSRRQDGGEVTRVASAAARS
jgi:hypothetical protein